MSKQHGIAANTHFRTLLYNEPTETLIDHFERQIQPTHSVGEIYTRKRGTSGYTKIPGGGDFISFHDPLSSSAAPYLFFNVLSHRAEMPEGADWDSVRRYDLRSGDVTTVTSESTMPIQSGYVRNWISSLLSVDAEGNKLLCSVGFERSTGELSTHVDYWLCALPNTDPVPQKILILLDTFF